MSPLARCVAESEDSESPRRPVTISGVDSRAHYLIITFSDPLDTSIEAIAELWYPAQVAYVNYRQEHQYPGQHAYSASDSFTNTSQPSISGAIQMIQHAFVTSPGELGSRGQPCRISITGSLCFCCPTTYTNLCAVDGKGI